MMRHMEYAAVLYSCGKDGHYAMLKAQHDLGLDVKFLVIVTPDRPSHQDYIIHIPPLHAKLMGKELIRVRGSSLGETLHRLGVRYVIAGDIDLSFYIHVDWIRRNCEKFGIEVVEPIFNIPTRKVLEDIVTSGIEFFITCVKDEYQELLGMTVNTSNKDEFLKLVDSLNVDPCGEFGEFHTIVTDSPLFTHKIVIERYKIVKLPGKKAAIPVKLKLIRKA